jgi:multidrug efflux system membrane fusion protein
MSETPPTLSPGAPSPLYRAPPPRRRPAWRTLVWIVVALVAAIVVAMLLTPHGAKPAGGGRGGPGGGRMPSVVGVATAVRGDVPLTLSALGTVTPEATITVQSQIAGVLEKVDFTEGQTVRKGQLLAEIDTRPYAVQLAQAQGALARDQASLADARLDLKRYQTLAAQDSISGQQLDTQAALVKQDEGTVKTDEANIASAKLNLTYCHIVAPVAGRVGLRQVDPGNYVTSGLANGVVVITQFDPIDVVFTLPEDNVPQIAARISQGATLSVTALDRTGAATLAQGILLTLDNQIDTSTGTIKAKARFSNPRGVLFPNQFVNVTLLVDTLKNAVVIPTAAVRHGANGDYVFIVGQDPIMGGPVAQMVNIKAGPSQGDRTSIASGVNVGDQVVTDGGDRLTDGGAIVLPGSIPRGFTPPAKKPGFFGWLAGLFGHKPAGAESSPAAAGGGASPAGGGGYGGGGGRGGGAARMQAMFDQLDLTPDQKTKVAAIQADMRAKMAAAGDDSDARRAAMKDGMTRITALLTPDQKAKMAQLRAAARASYGGGGSGAPAAAPASGEDRSAQSDQPPGAASSPATPSGAPSADARPAGPGPGGPAGGGRGGGDRALLMQVLDDDQKAKLKAMVDEARASGDPAAFQAIRGKIAAMLRPDQKAKLDQLRAAQTAGGGGQ